MSSRLFTEVRGKRGLAYYISTSNEDYTDTGYLATSAGVPNGQVAKAISLILKEYRNIKERKISPRELKKAKDYLKGSLVLGLESSDAQASFYAVQELLRGKILTIEEKCAKINQVTSGSVSRVACDIFQPEKLNLALIGPHKEKEGLAKLLKL